MKKVSVHVIHAFVDGGCGGNPAGIVLNADGLSQEEKQFVAARAGFSETAFVSRSSCADFKIDFFTPIRQISDCGHATVAAFSYLSKTGQIEGDRSSKEITDGIFNVVLKDDMVFMEQVVAGFIHLDDITINHILTALGLTSSDLMAGYTPVIATNNESGIIVPLKSNDSLKRIHADFKIIEAISKRLNTVDIYPFSLETEKPGRDAGARMFAPILGIPEEAATGMAAGRLACYLYTIIEVKKGILYIEQGYHMKKPSPSLLIAHLNSNDNRLASIKIGGSAQLMDTITIQMK